VPHAPIEQVMLTTGHIDPAPTHTSFTQQPPVLQAPVEQQGSPGLPQWVQTPALQTSLASQARPGQQAAPAVPQFWQMPPMQAVPVPEQVPPAQQAVPGAPQPAMSGPPPVPLLPPHAAAIIRRRRAERWMMRIVFSLVGARRR
jgi:hypothetical protein